MSEPSNKPVTLVRGLGVFASVSIVVGSVIGTGIFLKTRVMMCNVETPWLVIIAWIAAGFLSLAGALTYAELAAMMPRAGGEYVFIREGYGRPLAFLYGWTQFAVAYTGSQAAKGVSFAIFLNILAGGACEGVEATARGGLAGFGAAMLGALWAYDGWSNVTIVAGEVKRPQRNLPLALIGGILIVAALYIFANFAYLYVLSPVEVASVSKASSVATEVARKFLGPSAVGVIAMAMMISTLGSLHTGTLSGARISYAMAKDGLFFRPLARLSGRTRVPVNALILQCVWSCVLALSGSFDTLTDYVIFAAWIFYALNTASVFIFRRRMPHADRPYRTLGYPALPILFLLAAGWLIFNTLMATPKQAPIGLGIIALGLPIYFYWARKNPVSYHEPPTGEES